MKNITISLFLLWVIFAGVSVSYSQAYCALRDPEVAIREMYPEATSFRSIVRVIDKTTRADVAEVLPPQTLHFGELGRHTLYIVKEYDTTIGFVQVRSESTNWGLMEVAWAMDMGLRIKDFRLQRCRDKNRGKIEADSFREHLRGLNFADLKEKVRSDGDGLIPESLPIPAGSEALVKSLVFCGLKTLLVTELAWNEDIGRARANVWIKGTEVDRVIKVTGDRVLHCKDFLPKLVQNGIERVGTDLNLAAAEVLIFLDKENELLGLTLEAQVKIQNAEYRSSWNISSDFSIFSVHVDGVGLDVQRLFNKIEGKRLDEYWNCSSQIDLIAFEVLVFCQEAESII
ncbi:hypothetical protein MLD52_16180 [Puniceicoccaceae bacterium K14]|nr:hypothetical protein [Puniceicoccaceae bacterium K14]